MATRITWNSDGASYGVWTGRTKAGHTARIVRTDLPGDPSFVGHVHLKGEHNERPLVVSSRKTLAEAKRATTDYINNLV